MAGSGLVRSCSAVQFGNSELSSGINPSQVIHRAKNRARECHTPQIPFVACVQIRVEQTNQFFFSSDRMFEIQARDRCPFLQTVFERWFLKGSFVPRVIPSTCCWFGKSHSADSPDVCSMLGEVGRGVDPKCSPHAAERPGSGCKP